MSEERHRASHHADRLADRRDSRTHEDSRQADVTPLAPAAPDPLIIAWQQTRRPAICAGESLAQDTCIRVMAQVPAGRRGGTAARRSN